MLGVCDHRNSMYCNVATEQITHTKLPIQLIKQRFANNTVAHWQSPFEMLDTLRYALTIHSWLRTHWFSLLEQQRDMQMSWLKSKRCQIVN